MWSPPGFNVESYVESLRSPMSGVVDQRPPRPLVHLSQISGPVSPFFPVFARSWGFSVACRGAVGSFRCVGRLRGAGLGCPGAAKPTARVYCRCCGCGPCA